MKIKIYRTIIFPVLCGYETWAVTVREERRLRVLKNGVLRKIFGPERDEVMSSEDCTVRTFMMCTAHQILIR
jgi:hypothetical protein